MRLFIFLLLLAAFLQTSFLPINLSLILLICRSYAVHQQRNYYLALISGIFLGLLSTHNLGFWPLILLLSVVLVHTLRLLPISHKVLTIVPVTFLVILGVNAIESMVTGANFSYLYAIISGLVALPIYILIKEWEDRYMMKRDLKLRV